MACLGPEDKGEMIGGHSVTRHTSNSCSIIRIAQVWLRIMATNKCVLAGAAVGGLKVK